MNKKIRTTILFTMASVMLISCNDFLEMMPRDRKVVKTIEDHRDILASYMYLLKTPNRSQFGCIMGIENGWYAFPKFDVATNLAFYTGESTLKTDHPSYFDSKKNEYTEAGIKLLTWQETEHFAWDNPYLFLGAVNILIKEIKTAEGNNEDLRNYVQGEALVWRAFTYFKLLQYYAPYKNNAYGIPMYLDPSDNIGDAMPERKTQPEVYAQLLADCNAALELLSKTPNQPWNLAYRSDFVHALMAAVYTWKAGSGAAETNDWKHAEEHAQKAMLGRALVSSPDVLRNLFDCRDGKALEPLTNPEFYFRIVDGYNKQILKYMNCYTINGASTGFASPEYLKLYSDDDWRKSFYFDKNGRNDKYNFLDIPWWNAAAAGCCLMPFRLAEMYLIAAESACRQGKVAEGAQLLNRFKASRYNNPRPVRGDASQVLQEVLLERKREFYLENDMIWLDMKRLGTKVEREINGQKHTLEPNDFRYTFPIPRTEMGLNKKMKQNPGWENVDL